MLKGKITLCEQECDGIYNFVKTEKYMTKGFKSKFGEEAGELFTQSIKKIMEKYPTNAGRFQVLHYENDNTITWYWLIIDDYRNGTYVLTALLPEEYQNF